MHVYSDYIKMLPPCSLCKINVVYVIITLFYSVFFNKTVILNDIPLFWQQQNHKHSAVQVHCSHGNTDVFTLGVWTVKNELLQSLDDRASLACTWWKIHQDNDQPFQATKGG